MQDVVLVYMFFIVTGLCDGKTGKKVSGIAAAAVKGIDHPGCHGFTEPSGAADGKEMPGFTNGTVQYL